MLNVKDLILLLNKFIGQIKLILSQPNNNNFQNYYLKIIKSCKNLYLIIKAWSISNFLKKMFEKVNLLNPQDKITDYIIAFKQRKLLEKIKTEVIVLLNKLAKNKNVEIYVDGLLGISINNDQVVLIHLVRDKEKKIIIKSKGIFKLNIHDFDFQDQEQTSKVQSIISNYIKNNNLLQVQAAYVLASQQYALSLIELPAANEVVGTNSKEKAILLGIKDYLTYPINDAILDSFEIPVNRSSDNTKLAYGIAMRAKLSKDIGQLLNKCNVHLKYIDIIELCIRNVISTCTAFQDIGCLVLKIFPNNSSILLIKNQDLYICRNTNLNIKQLDNFDPFKDDMPEKLNLANNLLTELQRSLDYANNIFRTVNFNAICILPSSINLEKMINWLNKQLGAAVYNLDLPEIFGFSELSLDEKADFLLAIGAALR